jgi:aspartate ammonia-lyase
VIPEFVISVAHKVYANDTIITSLCAQGCLELNAYLPSIGHALLESLKLLSAADKTIKDNLLEGLKVNFELAERRLFRSPAITTALSPYIGYHKASALAKEMKSSGCDVFEANQKFNLMDENQLRTVLQQENLLMMGYSIRDLEQGS